MRTNTFILLLFIILVISCGNERKDLNQPDTISDAVVKEKVIKYGVNYAYNIIKNADNSFGYQIYKDGVKIIKQENMPAVPGNNGFETEKQAIALAELVIKKLENQIMPPTVSVEEVDSIRALK